MYKKISSKLLIFRAQKAVITPVIIGKSPKIDAWIDGASPCVENCQNQGGASPPPLGHLGGGDRSLAPPPSCAYAL